MDTVATTRALVYETKVPKGHWTYRIGLAANWLDSSEGDVLLVSEPVDVSG
jgi:hypothetical protein